MNPTSEVSPIRVLVVDDDERSFRMIRDFLAFPDSRGFAVDWASSYEAGLEMILKNQHDICLIDHLLGQRNGVELIREALAADCQMPLILVTAYGTTSTDEIALGVGAADYIDKTDLKPSTLKRSIRYAVERAKVFNSLRESERRFRGLFEQTNDAVFLITLEGNHLAANQRAAAMLGYELNELIGMPTQQIIPPREYPRSVNILTALKAGERVAPYERIFRRKDDSEFPAEVNVALIHDERGDPLYIQSIVRDISQRKQAEEQLRANQAQLIEAQQIAQMGSWSWDPQTNLITWSHELYRVLGVQPEPVDLTYNNYLTLLHPEDRAEVDRVIQTAYTHRQPFSVYYRLIHPEKGERHIHGLGRVIVDAEGNVISMLGTAQDITERKRAEDEEHLLSEARANLLRELDLPRLIRDVVEGIGKTFNYPLVSLYLREGDICILQHQIGYPTFVSQVSIRNGVSGRVLRSGIPELVVDVSADADFIAAFEGITSEICVPLFDHQETAGFLNVETTGGQRLTQNDLRLMIALGEHVSIAIQRARLYTTLRESEERFRGLFEQSNDGVMIISLDGHIIAANQRIAELCGYSVSELVGSPHLRLIPAREHENSRRIIEILQEGRTLPPYERVIVSKQGREFLVEINISLVKDNKGQPLHTLSIIRDISERKRIEQAEREQRALAEALLDTATALNSSLNLDEVIERILLNVRRVVPCDLVNIMLVESGIAHVVQAMSFGDYSGAESLRGLRVTVADVRSLREITATRKPVIVPDVSHYDGWITTPERAWVASYAGIPISVEGEVIGFLNFNSSTADFFTESFAERLLAFSNQVAIAIQNAQRHQQARELAVMNERQRIARDLHDSVSQSLFSASLMAEALPLVWKEMPAEARREFAEVHLLTRQSLSEMRSLLLELRPSALIETEIPELFSQLADTFMRRQRVPLDLKIDAGVHLTVQAKVVFYRVAQEALNNIGKHARAKQVELSIAQKGVGVEMRIRDNGRGFELSSLPSDHHGVRIMRERAEGIRAVLVLTSQPGQGSEIVLTWPGVMEMI